MSMAANANVDLVVVGTGSAAGAVAYKCRSAGWTVTVIDSRPFGGTCQLRGCDPKKVQFGAAHQDFLGIAASRRHLPAERLRSQESPGGRRRTGRLGPP